MFTSLQASNSKCPMGIGQDDDRVTENADMNVLTNYLKQVQIFFSNLNMMMK